jgi:hypothetical protein
VNTVRIGQRNLRIDLAAVAGKRDMDFDSADQDADDRDQLQYDVEKHGPSVTRSSVIIYDTRVALHCHPGRRPA